jgi:Reverse transcriptase (RNA-dependent DNA polymerase)
MGQLADIHYMDKMGLQSQDGQTKPCRIFSEHAIEEFTLKLAEINWIGIYHQPTVDGKFNTFLQDFLPAFWECFPKRQVRVRSRNVKAKGWLTQDIVNASKRKRHLRNITKNNPGIQEAQELRTLTSKLRTGVRQAKRSYHSGIINRASNKSKATWQIVNDITGKNKKRKENISLDIDGKEIADPEVVANYFNKYFSSIAETIVDTQVDSTEECLRKLSNLDRPEQRSEFQLAAVTPEDIIVVVKDLEPKTSSGWDEVPMCVLKKCMMFIAAPLAHIFTHSFTSGEFPDRMKYAIVKPIFKKGPRNEVSNYRPISLLTGFSKILEKLYLRQLSKFLEDSNTLCKEQHGFRKNYSTATAIRSLTEAIETALEDKLEVGAVFCDYSKAFDTIDHLTLVKKLGRYGVTGSAGKWISSYLSRRKQHVLIDGTKGTSDWEAVKHGLPQGSVLSPTLFSLQVNDLPANITIAKTTQFADDTSAVVTGNTDKSLGSGLSHTLNEIEGYSEPNKIALNLTKTVAITFCVKGDQPTPNIPLQISKEAKFLGIWLDYRLKWNVQIDHMCKTLSSACYSLKAISRECDSATLRTTYFALIQSRLQYGVMFWGGATGWLRVFILQKRAIRTVAALRPRDSCREYFKTLRIHTLANLHIMAVALFIRDNPQLTSAAATRHSHNTRGAEKIIIERHRLHRFDHSPLHLGIKVSNKLPRHIVQSGCRQLFKRNLEDFLLGKAYYTLDELFLDADL